MKEQRERTIERKKREKGVGIWKVASTKPTSEGTQKPCSGQRKVFLKEIKSHTAKIQWNEIHLQAI